jgi:hypothetical protein
MSILDPRSLVLDNYVQWKGEPQAVYTPSTIPDTLSPRFGVLEYAAEAYSVYCTAGASSTIQPYSQQAYDDSRGVRFEYLLHGVPTYHVRVCELLMMLASYPYSQNVLYESGSIIPIGGTVVPDSALTYVYLTYPYQDDPHIYTSTPAGQIDTDDVLIQTWWAIPISREEAVFVRRFGPDTFEKHCFERLSQNYDVFDFFRPSLITIS